MNVEVPELQAIADRIVAQAKAGEQIEAYVGRGGETSVRVYEGELEHFVSAQSDGVGIRVVKDGRTAFARWLAKHDIGTTSAYYGGRMVSSYDLVPEDRKSQSYDRKCAAVYAAVRVLNEAGIQAEAVTRLD